jgi:hypothetical protein
MSNHIVRNSIGSLAEIAQQTPQLYRMLSQVAGQSRRRRTARIIQNGAWLGAGLVVGAGLAALLSPTTGAQVRRRLAYGAERVRGYVASRANGVANGVAHDSANGVVTS